VDQLHFLVDDNSNSIGVDCGFIWLPQSGLSGPYLRSVKTWGIGQQDKKAAFGVAMKLRAEMPAKTSKANNLDFYLSALEEVRENTIQKSSKKETPWLMSVMRNGLGPTNKLFASRFMCVSSSPTTNGQASNTSKVGSWS